MASPAKKQKFNKTKNYFVKQNQKGNKNFLKIGDRGYLVTFSYKQKESLREVYKLLNEYHKEYYGFEKEPEHKDESADEDDIDDLLSKAIKDTKQESVTKTNLFNSVDTGANGCLFVKTTFNEFYELAERMVKDLSTLSFKKTKFTNRLVPIETVCRANMESIINACGELFDKHFLKEPSTFAINFNKRLNNDIQKDDVIKELAALVSQKNILNKVDLKKAKKTILVEKYNLNELSAKTDDSVTEKKYNSTIQEEKKSTVNIQDDDDRE